MAFIGAPSDTVNPGIVNDPGTPNGGDWFSQNAPSSDAFASQINALYQQYYQRDATPGEIQSHSGNPGGVAAVEQMLKSSQGTPAPAATAPAATAPTGDAAIRAQIAQWAAMPGADPSLANDPSYWVKAITDKGGLTDANKQYWQDASVGPTAFFNNPNRESSGAPLSGIGGPTSTPKGLTDYSAVPTATTAPTTQPTAPAATTYQAPAAPTYTNYTPGPAPTPVAFTAPTAADAAATPGYQFALDQGNLGLQRSAAAKGGLLSGGALKDISAYNVGAADTNYQNVWNNAFGANQAENANNLAAYQATTSAGLSAGQLNLSGTNQQFQNTYTPTWNAYLSNIGQGQFGANYGLTANQQGYNQNLSTNQYNLGAQNQGFNQNLSTNQFNLGAQNQGFNQNLATNQFNLGAQNQYWGQGLQENQNAYNQYNTSQTNAFDQWYKTAQLGNPGNPYA